MSDSSHTPSVASGPEWEPRVLVVDDDPICRIAARGLLERLGLSVDTAADGGEAQELAATWAYTAIFMDCYMPEIDGYEFIRRVRTLGDEGARIPAIALTAYARTEDRTQALRAGFDMHLTKPVEPSELLVVIGTLIEGVRRRVR